MKVKSDHRSKFSNLSNWKEEAWNIRASKGFEPVTSAMAVRCSTNWAAKPHIRGSVFLLNSYLPVQWNDVKYIWTQQINLAMRLEHHTGIAEVTGSNPVGALIFSGFFLPIAQIGKFTAMITHSLLSSTTAVQIWISYIFHNGTNAWQLVTSTRHYHLNSVSTKV